MPQNIEIKQFVDNPEEYEYPGKAFNKAPELGTMNKYIRKR